MCQSLPCGCLQHLSGLQFLFLLLVGVFCVFPNRVRGCQHHSRIYITSIQHARCESAIHLQLPADPSVLFSKFGSCPGNAVTSAGSPHDPYGHGCAVRSRGWLVGGSGVCLGYSSALTGESCGAFGVDQNHHMVISTQIRSGDGPTYTNLNIPDSRSGFSEKCFLLAFLDAVLLLGCLCVFQNQYMPRRSQSPAFQPFQPPPNLFLLTPLNQPIRPSVRPPIIQKAAERSPSLTSTANSPTNPPSAPSTTPR